MSVAIKITTKMSGGWDRGSAGKGIWHWVPTWVQSPEHGGRREPAPTSCALTSICAPQHVCAHTCMGGHISKTNAMTKVKKKATGQNCSLAAKNMKKTCSCISLHQSENCITWKTRLQKRPTYVSSHFGFETGSQSVASGSQLLRLQACTTMPSLGR